ncbi:MAG: hypothetical protein ACYSTG_05685 [Planctomycetota bacterium]
MGDNATRTRYPLVGSKDAVSAKSVGMLPATETEWQARGCDRMAGAWLWHTGASRRWHRAPIDH